MGVKILLLFLPGTLLHLQLCCLRVTEILDFELGRKPNDDGAKIDSRHILPFLHKPLKPFFHCRLRCQNFIVRIFRFIGSFEVMIFHLDGLWFYHLFGEVKAALGCMDFAVICVVVLRLTVFFVGLGFGSLNVCSKSLTHKSNLRCFEDYFSINTCFSNGVSVVLFSFSASSTIFWFRSAERVFFSVLLTTVSG